MSDVLDRLRNKLNIRFLVFAEEELRAICDAVDAQRAELKRLRVVERNYNRVAATTLSAVEGCECAICTGELALEDIDHHRLVASEAQARAERERVCTWTEEEEGPWHTGCGHAFEFTNDGPVENGAKHCCYCGGKLQAKEFIDAE